MKKRIYYHDTDCGGVVYHGNYLKFLEEARTEYLEERGQSVKGLMERGIIFVVRHQDMDYKHPAFYNDVLDITTSVKEYSNVRIKFVYEIYNQDGRLIAKASTDLVSVDLNLKLAELPEDIKKMCAAAQH
jgi:acyl-CoA thioester hydrolase